MTALAALALGLALTANPAPGAKPVPAAPTAKHPAAAAKPDAELAAPAAAAAAARPAKPPRPAALAGVEAGDWHVEGKTFSYKFKLRQTELTGEPVKMTRQDAVLTCKRVVLQNDESDQLQTATCLGDVTFVRGTSTITCQKATWAEAVSRLTCEGDPMLRDGDRVARGTLLVYDLIADEANLDNPDITVPGNSEDAKKALDARRGQQGGKK